MKNFKSILVVAAIVASKTITVQSLSATTSRSTKPKSKSPMFEYLKFDAEPTFDVLAKAKEYVDSQGKVENINEWYAPDYVLRGPVIGPMVRKDLDENRQGLGILEAFPDLEAESFGFTVDPENPYRCFYFQRWRATHTVDMDSFGQHYPATGNEMETPVSAFTVVFNPDGKIVYEQVGAVIDRHEGNTQGKAAVFGLLHTAGMKLSANPGDMVYALVQRIAHLLGAENAGRSWSRDEDIPSWWQSPSRGADDTEQW